MQNFIYALAVRLTLIASAALIACNLFALAARFPALFLVPMGYFAWRNLHRTHPSDTHGSARPSSLNELVERRMVGHRGGLILGSTGYMDSPTPSHGVAALFSTELPTPLACRLFLDGLFGVEHDMLIRSTDYVHLLTCAPSGAGKGVGSVITSLKSYRRSIVAVDPKGENYLKAAEHRQRRFRRHSARLDPFGVCGTTGDSLNPLDYLLKDQADLYDACRDLANFLVFRTGTEHDPHWNDRAEQLLSICIYFICKCETNPARRNLLAVRSIVRSRDTYLATLNVMAKYGGTVKDVAESLSWLQGEELDSVMSAVDKHTAWMESPVVAECLKRSTFDLKKLRTTLDLYYVLPPDRLETLAPLMRLWIGTTLRVLTRGQADESQPVLFLIDEAAQIGRIRILETAITLMRGYGIRIWLFFQSLNQLNACYGTNAQTVLDNLGTQQYFGISNSFDTAEAISKRIGDHTVTQVSVNVTKGRSKNKGGSPQQADSGSTSSSTSYTTSETGRRWVKPEEVMTGLPDDLAWTFHRNLPVIPAKLCKYYQSPAFRGRRSGDDGGLGWAAGLIAAGLMLAALLLSAAVANLPPPPATRRPAAPPRPIVVSPPIDPRRQLPPLPARRSSRNGRVPGRGFYPAPIR